MVRLMVILEQVQQDAVADREADAGRFGRHTLSAAAVVRIEAFAASEVIISTQFSDFFLRARSYNA
jgi:hypothetical protein